MRTKIKIQPEEIYECFMAFSGTNPDGAAVNVRAGTRMRGSDEAVARWPQFFLADGATDGEKMAAYREIAGPRTVPDPAPAATVLEKMSGPDVVEAIDTYNIGYEIVQAGERFKKTHSLVRKHPEIFKAVVEA